MFSRLPDPAAAKDRAIPSSIAKIAMAALAALAALPARAVVLSVDDFRADMSNQAADTANLDPAWGDTLTVGPRTYRPTAMGPYLLSDAETAGNSPLNGKAGGTSLVVSTSSGAFRCAYVAWDVSNTLKAVDDGNFTQPTHLVVRDVAIGEGTIVRANATRLAGDEILRRAKPAKTYPPSYFHFLGEGGRYAAYWGNVYEQGNAIRRTTHAEAAGGGSASTWGRYLFLSGPTDTVFAAGLGKLGAALVPGTGGTRTVFAYESNVSATPKRTRVRWDDLGAGTHQSVEFQHTNNIHYGQDYALAADSAGNVVVLWREGADNANTSDLYLAAFDSSRAQIVAPVLLQAAVSLTDGTTSIHYYRSYAVASVANGNFLVSFARGGVAYAQAVAVPFGAQAFSAGSPVQVSDAGDNANYPGIAVNRRQVLFGWFAKSGGNHALKGALYDRSGVGFDQASRQALLLSDEAVSFSQVGGGWYGHHYIKAPSLALDDAGNIAAAYDNQFHAKAAFIANFAVYHDSAHFASKALRYSALQGPLPVDETSDSLEFLDYRVVAGTSDGSPTRVELQAAVSRDGSFADAGSAFQAFPAGRRSAGERFKYRLAIKAGPDSLTRTKVDSLILRFNAQPRRPTLDSLRIGTGARSAYDPSGAYVLLRRLDSLHVTVSGIDLDDQSEARLYLCVAGRPVDSATAPRTSPARYRARFSFLPSDTLPDPLRLSFRMRDSAGWLGPPIDFSPGFRNAAPAETLSLIRSRGLDSAGRFWPWLGAKDTLAVAPSQTVVLQEGDTATLNVRLGDVNDDSLTFRLLRNGDTVETRRAAAPSAQSVRFAADTLPPLVDTLVALLEDADTATAVRFLVRPNRPPAVDSLWLAAYLDQAGTRMAGPFDAIRDFARDSGLQVPSGLPSVLRAGATDRDAAFGDGARITWAAYAPQSGCPAGNLACYARTAQGAGDSLAATLALPQEYLVVRATDSSGAFRERRVRLEFPLLDTASAASFRAAVKALAEDLDFVLESSLTSRTVQAEITSLGNVPLQILSVTTSRDDARWLGLKLVWEAPGTPPRPDSLRIAARTDSNAVAAGTPPTVAVGSRLTLAFTVSSDSLRGDSVLVDTVLLRTNDLANPFIRIPIRVVYNDLPVLRLSHLGGEPGPSGGLNDGGLPKLLPVRSRLVFAFSEPVVIPEPERFLRVYSWLDSLKNPGGYAPIPGVYEYRRRALPKRAASGSGRPAGSAGRAFLPKSAAADSLADTLVFSPAYDRPSDSLKVRPAPGAFIHGDIIRIAIGNGARDRAGNALDLRLDKRALAPGTLDTVFTVRVDTGVFRVASSVPAAGQAGWDPDSPLRVRFNRRLALRPPRGTDSLTPLDPGALRADSNRGVWVRSTSRGARKYDFQFLAVEDGDSTLVFRTRPRLASRDTVTVTLSGGILDVDGLSLDGNRDGFPSAFYDPADSSDDFRFTFSTRAQAFYIFPNPYRHGDPRHAEKGSITFKNINALPGFVPGKEVELRIHTMTGDLVYSSATASRRIEPEGGNATLDWNLRNNAGVLAGTGVYVYTLQVGGSKLLRKGKVAVIR